MTRPSPYRRKRALPRSDRQSRTAGAAPRSTTRRAAYWLRRADALCGALNRVLLAGAIVLTMVVLTLERHPDWAGRILRHPEWLLPAFDAETGVDPQHLTTHPGP
jgi:hypothetical protein